MNLKRNRFKKNNVNRLSVTFSYFIILCIFTLLIIFSAKNNGELLTDNSSIDNSSDLANSLPDTGEFSKSESAENDFNSEEIKNNSSTIEENNDSSQISNDVIPNENNEKTSGNINYHDTKSNVNESEKNDGSYFSDAVFIGDSITEGLRIYLDNISATVLASRGLNPDSLLTTELKYTPDEKFLVLDGIKRLKTKKVYLMLGTNGIAFMEKSHIVQKFSEAIDKIHEIDNEIKIYIQSIPPVTKEYEMNDNRFSLQNISDYNHALYKMSNEKGVYFLNVNEILRDEFGYLPSEKSPDGYHFNRDLYLKWYDFLLTHIA